MLHRPPSSSPVACPTAKPTAPAATMRPAATTPPMTSRIVRVWLRPEACAAAAPAPRESPRSAPDRRAAVPRWGWCRGCPQRACRWCRSSCLLRRGRVSARPKGAHPTSASHACRVRGVSGVRAGSPQAGVGALRLALGLRELVLPGVRRRAVLALERIPAGDRLEVEQAAASRSGARATRTRGSGRTGRCAPCESSNSRSLVAPVSVAFAKSEDSGPKHSTGESGLTVSGRVDADQCARTRSRRRARA